jgi:hypothetical protein
MPRALIVTSIVRRLNFASWVPAHVLGRRGTGCIVDLGRDASTLNTMRTVYPDRPFRIF